jgi:hypothetical protein
MAAPESKAFSRDGNMLAAAATAMPVATVPRSRRRSWSMISVLVLVFMASS